MNYDGPSFYRKQEDRKQENKIIGTPLDDLRKKQRGREQLSHKIAPKKNDRKTPVENRYFRSKQIPKSLQNREGWKVETWSQEFISELQKRLKKEPTDFLLFADNLIEEVEEEIIESSKKKEDDTSVEAVRTKKMIAEIENTLDTAALVQKEIKPDLKRPNTGLHRTLSNIIAEDRMN